MLLTRTTTAMLDDLLDPENEQVWQLFDERYRPILVGFARRLGLQPEDAADAAQETLRHFVRSYREGKYQRDRGRLRSWLVGIARNCIMDLRQQAAARPERPGLTAIDRLPDEQQLTTIWDDERDRAVLGQALDALRRETRTDERTIHAFEQVAIQQQRPAAVAAELGMSLNDVYLAKHRCLRRLRGLVDELTAAYERDT
jgi:RNA polymerase sigma factor (sigma-70 family)